MQNILYTWFNNIIHFCCIDNNSTVQPDQPASERFDSRVIKTVSGYLKRYKQKIQRDFAFFTSAVHDKVMKHREVTVEDLCYFLLQMPALTSVGEENEEHSRWLCGVRNKFENASTTAKLFYLLSEHTSFLDYQIYIDIAEKYYINVQEEKERYLTCLNEYINKHTISELVEHKIIPRLICKEFTDASKTLIFKLDIKMSGKFAELIDLKVAVAELLGFEPYALQLIYIEKGSVLVTFLVPAGAADYIFPRHKTFTEGEKQQFRALSVVWLKYENHKFHFSTEKDKDVVKPSGNRKSITLRTLIHISSYLLLILASTCHTVT